MKNKNIQSRKVENRKYRSFFLCLFSGFLAIYPFIARLCIMRLPEAETEIYRSTNGVEPDLVCYAKEIALIVFAGILILYFLGEKIFPDNVEKIDRNNLKSLRFPIICAAGYGLLTLLSFLTSDYKTTALFGVNSEYEGLLAILSYLVLFFFGLYYMKPSSEKIRPLVILRVTVIFMCFIAAILSLIEVFDKPILEFTFIQDLISSKDIEEIAHSITCENFIGQIALLFNNPGYLGGFCALFMPILFASSLEYSDIKSLPTADSVTSAPLPAAARRKSLHVGMRILCIVTFGIMGLALIWSRSTVAKISLFISIPVVILLYLFTALRKLSLDKKDVFSTLFINLIGGLIIASILVFLSDVLPNSITRKHDQGLDTTLTELSAQNSEDSAASSDRPVFRLKKALLENGVLKLYSEDSFLQVSMQEDALFNLYLNPNNNDPALSLCFSDGEKELTQTVPAVMQATAIMDEMPGFKLADPRYEAITIVLDDQLIIFDFGYSGTVEFYMTEKGIQIFGQGSNLLEEIPQPRLTGLESLYTFATGRGYVWVQTLPLLKDCIILGYGNGCYGFYFRQNEIVGLLNTHGSCKYVIDRPHNWYLQICMSSGVPAMLLVLMLFIFYIFSFLRPFFTKKKTTDTKSGSSCVLLIGIFAGLLGFMLCGMINDSYITVNPLFWVLLGVGITNLNLKNTADCN